MRISDWSSDVCSFRSRRPGGRHFCICVPFRTAPKEGVVSRPVAPYNRLMASTKSAPGTTVKYRMPSVHPEGVKFVVIAAVICAALAFFGWETLAWPMAGITLWVAAFFRDRSEEHTAEL